MQILKFQAATERQENELRNRVASLQEDLENNEATQQDFVQLSQSLQMELERLREAEKEVRWQHEDDVDECPGCKQQFTVTRRKVFKKFDFISNDLIKKINFHVT
jgi:Rab GTPase-binding effector protein 1